jgi:hypothetical protein
MLTAVAAFFAFGGRRRISRFSDLLWATTIAALVAQPVGLAIQRYVTTSADVAGARVVRVRPVPFARLGIRHVDIEWSAIPDALALEQGQPVQVAPDLPGTTIL